MMSAIRPSTVSSRFLILSDTHNFEFEDNISSSLRLPIPKADVVLHCGDLTHCGGLSFFKKALRLLGAMDAELKLVIAGNHDLELDEEFWSTHLDEGDELEDHRQAVEVMKGRLAAEAGVMYLEEGTYTFGLTNGAKFTVYASPYTPAFMDWAFAYEYDEDRFNRTHQVANGVRSIGKNPMPSFPNVDIVMTHGPPKGILDKCPQGHAGCKNLLQALRRTKPSLHYFGHIHEGNGAMVVAWESGSETKRRVSSSKWQTRELERPGETGERIPKADQDSIGSWTANAYGERCYHGWGKRTSQCALGYRS